LSPNGYYINEPESARAHKSFLLKKKVKQRDGRENRNQARVLVMVSLIAFVAYTLVASAKPKVIMVPQDFSSIQEAVNIAAPGDTIIISPGTYLINKTIIIQSDNIVVKGFGRSTVLKAVRPINGPIIIVRDAKGVVLANMTLDGNKEEISWSEPWTPVVLFQWTSSLKVEGLYICNSSDVGLYLNYPGRPSSGAIVRNIEIVNSKGISFVIDGYAQNITVEDVRILNGDARGFLLNTAGGAVKNITLRRIYIFNTTGKTEAWYGGGAGINLDGNYGGSGENVTIRDCIVEEPASFGVFVVGEVWRDIKIINCTVKDNKDADAFIFADVKNLLLANNTSINSHIDGFAFGGMGRPPLVNVSVIGCKAIRSGLKTGGKGFMFYRVFNSTIINNQALETGGAGFYCRGCQNNIFIGNYAEKTSLALDLEGGITLLSDCEQIQRGSSNNTFMYNTLVNNRYGITIDVYSSTAYSTGNKFFHNNFINNTYPVLIKSQSTNAWDEGYPKGGNYWSSHVNIDEKKGLKQDEPGSDGIADTPFIINTRNIDNYPLANSVDPHIIASTILQKIKPVKKPIIFLKVNTSAPIFKEGIPDVLLIFIANKGDAPAEEITIRIEGIEASKNESMIAYLSPGSSEKVSFTIIPRKGGNTKVTITIRYRDLENNNYTDTYTMTAQILVKLIINTVDEEGKYIKVPLGLPNDTWINASARIQIEVPNVYQIDPHTRYIFKEWSDGHKSSTRVLNVNTTTQRAAIYTAQFLLQLYTPIGNTTGTGWYTKGQKAQISINPISTGIIITQEFSHWQDEEGNIISTSPTCYITITKPTKLYAVWKTNYTNLVITILIFIIMFFMYLYQKGKTNVVPNG
jgi:parallel beta-helix repeat protein